MRIVVGTHGHCFDGVASAAVFTRLARAVDSKTAAFEYVGLGYGATQRRPDEQLFSGDRNAVLDYRFIASERLDWYFDHHRTAFGSAADRGAFDARRAAGRYHHDPDRGSCAGLVADVAREQFGVELEDLRPLIEWAERIDTASFASAEDAVRRDDPVRRMADVIEHYGGDELIGRLAAELAERPLAEVAGKKKLRKLYQPLERRHERFVERVKRKAERRGRVVLVDLTDSLLESVGKFVTYALFPDSTYSVIVGRLKGGPKISVGYNPWCGRPLDVDISAICARYGGGGHAVVGGVAFAAGELERAREIARVIADELA
jgi:hypothetical protein